MNLIGSQRRGLEFVTTLSPLSANIFIPKGIDTLHVRIITHSERNLPEMQDRHVFTDRMHNAANACPVFLFFLQA